MELPLLPDSIQPRAKPCLRPPSPNQLAQAQIPSFFSTPEPLHGSPVRPNDREYTLLGLVEPWNHVVLSQGSWRSLAGGGWPRQPGQHGPGLRLPRLVSLQRAPWWTELGTPTFTIPWSSSFPVFLLFLKLSGEIPRELVHPTLIFEELWGFSVPTPARSLWTGCLSSQTCEAS